MLAGDGHIENKHFVAFFRFDQVSVLVQRNLRQVGVDPDLGHILGAVHIAAAAGVYKGLLAPVRLVQVEGVLFDFAVKGDKALLVLAVFAALVAPVGGKVEHIPDMGRPQPRAVGNHFCHVLVVDALVGFGIVALFGVGALVGGVGVRAVLRKTDAAVGIFGVVGIKKVIVLIKLAQVPAKIQVVAVHIGNFQNRAGDFQHKDVRHRGRTGRVKAVRQFVQGAVVFQQLLIHRAGGGNFVGQPPNGNAGVVVVLHDEFFHLGQRVGAPVVHVHRDVGDFRPDDKTLFVAQVIECLRVLVVGKADGVGAYFKDQRHILLHHLFGDGHTRALAVLMAGNTTQGIGAPVQDKALLRVNFKLAAAEAGGLGLAIDQPRSHGVEIRVIKTVPQAGMLQREHGSGGAVLDGNARLLAIQCEGDTFGTHHSGLHRHFTAAGVEVRDNRRDLDGHRAVFSKGKMSSGHNMQRYIAVNAAVEGEIGFLRVDGVVVAVVHSYAQQVAAVAQRIGNVHAKCRIAALMLSKLLLVQVDLGGHGNGIKLQNGTSVFRQGDVRQHGGVAAGAAVVVVAAVLPVDGVPGVGQGDGFVVSFFGKNPVLVQKNCLAHNMTPYVWI